MHRCVAQPPRFEQDAVPVTGARSMDGANAAVYIEPQRQQQVAARPVLTPTLGLVGQGTRAQRMKAWVVRAKPGSGRGR